MKEKILIIEDDEAIIKVLHRVLSYEGYEIFKALNGQQGLNSARENHPDLVILDMMLPGMDGLEVCRRLRLGGSMPISDVDGQRYHSGSGHRPGCRSG